MLCVRERFRYRLGHARHPVGDEELGAPYAPLFWGFEETGPIARAFLRHRPEVQGPPPAVLGYPYGDLDASLGRGGLFAAAPFEGDARPVHEDDDAFGQSPIPEFGRFLRRFGYELPYRSPGEFGGRIGRKVPAYPAQGKAFGVKPLGQVLEVVRAPLADPQHPRLERREPIPRDPQGQRAIRGLEGSFAIAVPVDPLSIGGGRGEQEALDLAAEGLIEGPFEFRSDERIQAIPQRRGGLLGRR